MEPYEILMLTAIFLFGGVVKGALGIGLPALLIGLLTFHYEPRVAVAMILIAIMATNFRQAWLGGAIWPVIMRHRYFCIFASLSIFVVAFFGAYAPVHILQTCVGIAMVIFALTSLFATIPTLAPDYNRIAQITAGIGSGVLGGLTAIWGPPLAIYLMSLKLEKDEMIKALGVMFSVQSLFLTGGFIASGELTARIAMIGVILLVPTFIGMYYGEKIRKRMNTVQFMRVFLIVFLMLGLNLLRRGLLAG